MNKKPILRLRALANAAPRGPWHAGQSSGYSNPNVANADGPLLSTGNARQRTRTEQAALAQYVAAIDPNTLLALLDLLDEYEAAVQYLTEAIDWLADSVRVAE